MHRYMLAIGESFRFYLQRFFPRNDQETSLGAGVLDGRAQEPVDQLFQNHLTGNSLRHFDYGREVELFDRRLDRARWTRRALVLPQPRMELIELPNLSVGSPSEIALPCLSQVEM